MLYYTYLRMFMERTIIINVTPCTLPVFIKKSSKCKKVELSTVFLEAFVNFKYFCSTWMVLLYISAFPSFQYNYVSLP